MDDWFGRIDSALLAPCQIGPCKRGIAVRRRAKVHLCVGVQLRQLVVGDLRPDVVFDVVGHVPRQPVERAGGKGCSGVQEHVFHLRAVAVFGQQVKTQGGLSDQCGQNPHPEEKGRDQQGCGGEGVERAEEAGLCCDGRLCAFGHPIGGEVAARLCDQLRELAAPVGQAADVEQPLAAGGQRWAV